VPDRAFWAWFITFVCCFCFSRCIFCTNFVRVWWYALQLCPRVANACLSPCRHVEMPWYVSYQHIPPLFGINSAWNHLCFKWHGWWAGFCFGSVLTLAPTICTSPWFYSALPFSFGTLGTWGFIFFLHMTCPTFFLAVVCFFHVVDLVSLLAHRFLFLQIFLCLPLC